MLRIRVFIGSSTESSAIALDLAVNLEGVNLNISGKNYEWTIDRWNKNGVFHAGETVIEGLNRLVSDYDFAVFVLGMDDQVEIRDQKVYVPRDNVIFEYGYFMSRLGRDRVFGLVPEGYDEGRREMLARVLTDLNGVILLTYRISTTGQVSLDVAIKDIINTIKRITSTQEEHIYHIRQSRLRDLILKITPLKRRAFVVEELILAGVIRSSDEDYFLKP